MSNQELSKQLALKIFNNLSPVLSKEFEINRKVKFENENGNINSFSIFCAIYNNNISVAVINLYNEYGEIIIVIKNEANIFTIKLEENRATFMVFSDQKWVDMSILHRLNLCAAFELIAQEAIPAIQIQDENEMYNLLVSVLEL